jgi:hypothetical protein
MFEATRNTPPNDWLRQGSAALVGLIVIFGCAYANAEGAIGVFVKPHKKTELGIALPTKNIFVPHNSVAIDSPFAFGTSNFGDFVSSKVSIGFGVKHNIFSCADNEHASFWVIERSCVERSAYGMIHNLDFALDRDLSSWRLSSIYRDKLKGEFGNSVQLVHIFAINKEISPQLSARSTYHYEENGSLQESADSNRPRENNHPPIGRRFFLMVGSILSGLFLAFNAPDDDRVLLSAACVGGGLLLIGCGLGLWWITLFPATWGWLL